MDLKLEIEGLIQVKDGLLACSASLEKFQAGIESQEQGIVSWVGQGKNAYLELLQPLRKQAENCSARLYNSAVVLVQSLNQYIETENQLQTSNMQLPAEDIF